MRPAVRTAALAALLIARSAAGQDQGHKVLGTLGLRAGEQPETGLHVSDDFLFYDAEKLFDRNGAQLPVRISLQAISNEIGIAGSYELPHLSTWVNAAVAVPLARVVGQTDRPEASIDRFGLADAYVQPLSLGWRPRHGSVRVGYAFYVPTARYEPGGGSENLSRGAWSHELSFGGGVRLRPCSASALASVEIEDQKLGAEITRGVTVQIQGGGGIALARTVDIGMVGYALWQITDDTGRDLPPVLRGAHDRIYGLGAELELRIPEARAGVTLRYAHDLVTRSLPQGQVLLVGIDFAVIRTRRYPR
jgi:hypothetical protein